MIRSLGWEDPLEKGMATHPSILAWRIPWTEEPVGDTVHRMAESDTTERLTLSLGCVNTTGKKFFLSTSRMPNSMEASNC